MNTTIYLIMATESNWNGPLDDLGGSTEIFFHAPVKAYRNKDKAEEFVRSKSLSEGYEINEIELIE